MQQIKMNLDKHIRANSVDPDLVLTEFAIQQQLLDTNGIIPAGTWRLYNVALMHRR